MAATGNALIGRQHVLQNSLMRAVFGKSICYVVGARNLHNANLASSDELLHPELGQFNMPQLPEATTRSDSFGCAGICVQNDWCRDSEVTEHAVDPYADTGAFNKTVIFSFAGGEGDN